MAGKTKPVFSHQGREYLTITKLSQYKKTYKIPSSTDGSLKYNGAN
jgi:hypothetical protein